MKLIEKLKGFLIKLQGLDDVQKKIILWSVVVILAIILGFFWIRGTINKLSNVDIQLPDFNVNQALSNAGSFDNADMPDISSLENILRNTTPNE